MKLGKKLEVTDIKERLKLLIDGEVFLCLSDSVIKYDDSDTNPFRIITGQADISLFSSCNGMGQDWYYPAKTYIINGVELEDNRLSYEEAYNSVSFFVSSAISRNCSTKRAWSDFVSSDIRDMCDSGLIHSTREAAIAHRNAMIKVIEQ